jgi:hypothetical protein
MSWLAPSGAIGWRGNHHRPGRAGTRLSRPFLAGEGFGVEFRVSDVRQTASGGSYVVRYHAEVEAAPGDGSAIIEVVSTIPEDADPELLSHTIEYIRRGAESVLRPLGLWACLKLHRLVIHDVDCNPRRFEGATAEGLASALEAHPSA